MWVVGLSRFPYPLQPATYHLRLSQDNLKSKASRFQFIVRVVLYSIQRRLSSLPSPDVFILKLASSLNRCCTLSDLCFLGVEVSMP